MGSDAPDTSGQNAAALQQVELSKDQLDWAKSIYADSADERAQATETAQQVSQAQLDATTQQTKIAGDAYTDYKTTYQPIEQKLAADAVAYDTPERRAAAAAAASSGVEQQVSAQRDATSRNLSRMGVDPSSGKALALQGSMDIGAAAAKAGASNAAERQVATVGAAKLADVANLGRGIASAQGTNASLALNQGNSAVANAGAATTAATSGAGVVQQGFSGASTSLNSAAGIYGNIATTQSGVAASNQGNMTAGIGAAATAAAIFM